MAVLQVYKNKRSKKNWFKFYTSESAASRSAKALSKKNSKVTVFKKIKPSVVKTVVKNLRKMGKKRRG